MLEGCSADRSICYWMAKMIPVCQPTVSECDIAAIASVMRSRWLSTGSVVSQFEEALCKETGYPYCVALSSCTAAMFLALKAYKFGPGNVIGVPALTFTATAAVVEHVGAQVKFLDVDSKTWLTTGDEICDTVITVDLYGQLAGNDKNTLLIEDGAHAVGADLHGGAETICLSFYATKNITTMGEGGAVVTRSKAVADDVRCMSLHGLAEGAWNRYASARNPEVKRLGYKANMTDAQAAMGLQQLEHLPEWRERREVIAKRYDEELDMHRPLRSSDGIVHLYSVMLSESANREEFRRRLHDMGVGTGVHYRSLTDEPYWKERCKASCPVAEEIGRRTVSLPLYPHLTEEQQTTVIKTVKEVLGWQ